VAVVYIYTQTVHRIQRMEHITIITIVNTIIMTNLMYKFVIYSSIYFCLTCFGLSISPSSEAGVKLRQWFKSPGYGVSARALTPYPGDLNHCRICTPNSEDGLTGSPKHVRQ
jgi:hypothetical protein